MVQSNNIFDINPPQTTISSDVLSGGNFEELFHSEYSEFFEADPIIDTIAPNCPTNLKAVINSAKKTFLFTWYYPLSNSLANDKSIQNDIKEFELFIVSDTGDLKSVGKTPIPRYFYIVVGEDSIKKAMDTGIKFCVKAIDYHNLISQPSQVIRVFINRDYGCKKLELDPIYESHQCGISPTKKYVLRKYAQFFGDNFTFSPGSLVSIKDPFKNGTNTLIITVKDLNTGNTIDFELDVVHQSVRRMVMSRPTVVSNRNV